MPATSGRFPRHMGKATLHALGTGDGWAGDSRGHSAFVYRLGGRTLLIDCGEPVSRRLRAAGIAPDDLDGILLTHLHCDHVGGFFMLMQGFWLEKRTRDLTVHMPAEGLEPVRRMLDAAFIFRELMPAALDFAPLTAGEPLQIGPIKITPHPTTHLETLRQHFQEKYPQGFEAFSFVLETEDTRIAHSGDIGAAADLEPLLAQPLDLFCCELAHVEPTELFALLAGKQIGHVCFTHLSRQHCENLEALTAQADETLATTQVTFLEDGEVVDISD